MGWSVEHFDEVEDARPERIGSKAAYLVRMRANGLPVPSGGILRLASSDLNDGCVPAAAVDAVCRLRERLERERRDANETPVLLLAVRPSPSTARPGAIPTIPNVGLTRDRVDALARHLESAAEAWHTYRRFLQALSTSALGVKRADLDATLEASLRRSQEEHVEELSSSQLEILTAHLEKGIEQNGEQAFPQDGDVQLAQALGAVARASLQERRRDQSPAARHGTNACDHDTMAGADDICIIVQSMVFGNAPASGSGVAFSRDPSTGEKQPTGDYVSRAQGDAVVGGRRDAQDLTALEKQHAGAFGSLIASLEKLERERRDLCEVEFVVERGRLWLVDARIGRRSARAEWIIASDWVETGTLDLAEALQRLDPARLVHLFRPEIVGEPEDRAQAHGKPVAPGVGVGRLQVVGARGDDDNAFDEDTVLSWAGEQTPDPRQLTHARGWIMPRSGAHSHAAVLARAEGIAAVAIADLHMNDTGALRVGERAIESGTRLTVDGNRGVVFEGELETRDSRLDAALAGDAEARSTPLWKAYRRFMDFADARGTIAIEANADTSEQVTAALRRGAQGVGLCRTESFLTDDEPLTLMRTWVLDGPSQELERKLQRVHARRFNDLLSALGDRRLTVRLLDAPLHEFLPKRLELELGIQRADLVEEQHVQVGDENLDLESARHVAKRLRALEETNPMLGLRGARVGVLQPRLFGMQLRALAEAWRQHSKRTAPVDVLVPMVLGAREFAVVCEPLRRRLEETLGPDGASAFRFGAMIETPRAALNAQSLARHADFVSFGTNDLTQMILGISRDDAGRFLPTYLEEGLLAVDPFVDLDPTGVEALIQWAVREMRVVAPDIDLCVCGEQASSTSMLRLCREMSIDRVSCAPATIPSARLAAAQVSLDG